ncbi:MAG: ATP-binding protein [Phaeodactylibacter sp.]|nr:ATP-binding protein [Phaeodactylibacter sp.]
MQFKKRQLLSQIEGHLSDKRHTIITGARQVGKTSILRMLYKQLLEEEKKAFFLSFEDIRILQSANEHPDRVFHHVALEPKPIMEGEAESRLYLLIDEVQYAKDPTNFLKYLYDKYESNVKVIATGSSAFYIDRKFKDSLAGRKRIFNLLPLSFSEYLLFKERENLQVEVDNLRKRTEYQSPFREELERLLFEYLLFGGYPAVVLENDPREKQFLLDELKNAYVKRDMLESGVAREGKFYLLLQLLADQVGNLTNKNELATTLQLDAKTVDNYLYILEKCYHVFMVRPFFRNLRKELTKMPKVYFNDLGLRNAFLNRFGEIPLRADKGQLLENYYFCQFRHTYKMDQIKYWRTADKQEIDFILEESFDTGKALEIKWNKGNFKPKKYRKFTEAYPHFELGCLGATDFYRF